MLNFKPDKLGARLLMLRWAVLGALVLAVGAVAVWGGARPQTEARQASGNLSTQLQAHIGADAQPQLVVADNNLEDIPTNITENTEQPENSSEDEQAEPTEPAEPDIKAVSGSSVHNEAPAEPEETPNEDDDTTANANIDVEPIDEVVDLAPEPWANDGLLTAEASLQKLQSPLSGSTGLSRSFGYGYDAAFDDWRFHSGVDLGGSLGAAVLAPLPGEIKEIRQDSFTGNSLVLQHEGGLLSAYYGLELQPGLSQGQQVIAGEKLGELCAPPPFEEAAGPHLHWELTLNDEHIDPTAYLKLN